MTIDDMVFSAYRPYSIPVRTHFVNPIEKKDTVELSEVSKLEWNDDLRKKHEENVTKQKVKYPFSYKYFENHSCEFFPCHPNATAGHNCMFCRCPLYTIDACVGIQNGDGIILENGLKDCTNCTYNHDYINAEAMTLA